MSMVDAQSMDDAQSVLVEAFIDHACPYSALQTAALRSVLPDASIRWRMLPLAERVLGLPVAERRMHAARFIADWPRVRASGASDYGMLMERPEWPIDSRGAAAAALSVRANRPEREGDLHSALFDARFSEGKDISQPGIIRDIVSRVAGEELCAGLREALKPSSMEAALNHDRIEAQRLVVRAVPALYVGGRLMVGAQRPAVIKGILAQASIGVPR